MELTESNYENWMKGYLPIELEMDIFSKDEILETFEGMTPTEAIEEELIWKSIN